MALGVECVLERAFDGRVEYKRIEQHRPLDVYPNWHPLRHAVFLRHGKGGRIAQPIKHLINRHDVSGFLWRFSWVGILDLGVVCGGPLITPYLSRGDLDLMYHHMLGAFASKSLPVLNLSVGSCYPWENIPKATVDGDNVDFLKRVFEYSSVATVRDELAQRLCADLGEQCELVPDTGFVAGRAFSELVDSQIGQHYIVINYQKYGANEDWGQNVDPASWRNILKTLIDKLRRRYKIVFICHNEGELRLAEKLDGTIPKYRPRTMQEYAQVISGAIAGICNRLHAAIPLASIGVPAIGVGTDSRLGTLQAIGLPCFYVKDVNVELLEDTLEKLIKNRTTEHERLVALREKALNRYVEIVRNAVTC